LPWATVPLDKTPTPRFVSHAKALLLFCYAYREKPAHRSGGRILIPLLDDRLVRYVS
jgi:hypothetical protein